MSDAKKFIDQEFPFYVRAQFVPILKTGASIADTIFSEHPDFYSNSLSPNIRGRLFAFSVMHQFSPEYGIFQKTLYEITTRKVNPFGYVIPEIVTDNAIMHIVKVPASNKIPLIANYKKELANNNSAIDIGQMKFEICKSENVMKLRVERKYILLTYGSKDNIKIDFAYLLMPDSSFTGILEGDFDLFKEMQLYKTDTPQESDTLEKKLVSLKEKVKESISVFEK